MKRMDLETKRLRIGEWTPELAEALFYLSQDESNRRFLPDEAFDTIAQAQAAIAEYIVNRHAGTGTQSCPVFRKGGTCICEYIFSLEGNTTNGARYHGVTFQNAGWGYYNTWGYFTPSLELYKAYEEGDQRRDVTILYPGQSFEFMGWAWVFAGYSPDGSAYDVSWSGSNHVSAGMLTRKFLSPWERSSSRPEDANYYAEVRQLRDKLWNSLNVCLMRYADVMLMKAEALIWTQGEGNAEAKELLNDIRERAGLPRNSQATKAQLQNERRCELAFEFQPSRFIDVVRWGLGPQLLTKPLHSVISKGVNGQIVTEEVEVYPARTFNPTYNKVFPIPERAFTGTVNLKQNKGY